MKAPDLPTLPPVMFTPKQAGAAAVAVGVLVTALISLFPSIPAAVQQPVLRVVIDTSVALVALLLSLLVYGRYTLDRRLADLVLSYALALAGAVNLLFAVLPQFGELTGRTLTILTWAPVTGRLLVAAGFATAAWVPITRRTEVHHVALWVPGAVLLTTAALGVGVAVLVPDLHVSAVPDLSATGPVFAVDGDQSILRVLRLIAMVLYGIAAVGFLRPTADALAPALVASSVLLAFGRLNLAAVPSLYPQWVYAGDLLRIAAYCVLLLAAVAQIRRYWQGEARLASQDERRRLARTLHDGVAQEVALLAAQTRLWANGGAGMEPRLLAGAAERALDESRAAIHALTGELDEPLDVAVLRVADDLQQRLGIQILTDVEPVPRRQREVHDAAVRAVREAVTNAARHGGAGLVQVTLRTHDGVRVTVVDDGCGFDVDAPRTGFGLVATRSRLTAVGGTLQVSSQPERGTTVTVELP